MRIPLILHPESYLTIQDVVPGEYLREIISHSYNAQIPTYLADQATWSLPYPVLGQLYKGAIAHQASMEPERFNPLEEVGFRVDRDGNLGEYFFGRFGGHYVDVGASKKIADGLVKNLLSYSSHPLYRNCVKLLKYVYLDQDQVRHPTHAIHTRRARLLRQLDITRRCGSICHRLPHKHAFIHL